MNGKGGLESKGVEGRKWGGFKREGGRKRAQVCRKG